MQRIYPLKRLTSLLGLANSTRHCLTRTAWFILCVYSFLNHLLGRIYDGITHHPERLPATFTSRSSHWGWQLLESNAPRDVSGWQTDRDVHHHPKHLEQTLPFISALILIFDIGTWWGLWWLLNLTEMETACMMFGGRLSVKQVCLPLEMIPWSLQMDKSGFKSHHACHVTAPSYNALFLIPHSPSHNDSRRADARLQCQKKHPRLSTLLRWLDH